MAGNKQETCQLCASMGLRVENFDVGLESDSTGGGTERHPKALTIKGITTGQGRRPYGTMNDIRASAESCTVCDLVFSAYGGHTEPKPKGFARLVDDCMCYHSWEVDGREIIPSEFLAQPSEADKTYQSISRRLRLSWDDKGGRKIDDEDFFLVRIEPANASKPLANGESHFWGHDISGSKGFQAMIGSWLHICMKRHRNCDDKQGTTGEFLKVVEGTYFGVLDVVDYQIKKLPKPNENYVCLSYRWTKDPYKTTRANLLKHLEYGGIERILDQLPKTIQDTIQLVKDLGYRYLWIDSLCIVQGNKLSWKLNAEKMDLIYGNAILTICAADGDADSGLLALRPATRVSSPQADLPGLGLQLKAVRPVEAVVRRSDWNRRAWTFQERILSPRCLIFAEGRVYFQCRSTTISQDIYPDASGTGWSLDLKSSPLRTLADLGARPIHFYTHTCVPLYTARSMTRMGDVLAAFRGIGRIMEDKLGAPLLFGLPTSHFDLALLWEPTEACERRANSSGDPDGEVEFPSWSWCGWMGKPRKKSPSVDNGKREDDGDAITGAPIEYRTVTTLARVLDDPQEWLLGHTWISWYVRDTNGDLRPLWDRKAFPPLQLPPALPDRWAGYARDGPSDSNAPDLESWSTSTTVETDDSVRSRGSAPPYDDVRVDEYPRGRGDEYPRGRGDEYPRIDERMNLLFTYASHHRHHRGHNNIRHHHRYEQDNINNQSGPPLVFSPKHSRSSSSYGNADYEDENVNANNEDETNNKGKTNNEDKNVNARVHDDMLDGYGRSLTSAKDAAKAVAHCGLKPEGKFELPLPDNPFGVDFAASVSRKGGLGDGTESDMPVLQFWTLIASFFVTADPQTTEEVEKTAHDSSRVASTVSDRLGQPRTKPGPGLVRCAVSDRHADMCGTVVVSDDFVARRDGSRCDFIALSCAAGFTAEEFPAWNEYAEKEFDDLGWGDVYYALLVQWSPLRMVYERVGLAKVLRAAFARDGAEWKEVKLG